MISIENADRALKEYYLDVVNHQLNSDVSPFYNAIAKTSENVYGKKVYMTVVKGGMSGVRAGGETDDLPAPRSNRYYNISVPLKNLFGTIEISDKAIRASADSSGAFVSLLNAEMEGLIADAKANFARMLYGNGTGLLANVVSKVSGTVLKVDVAKPYFINMNVQVVVTGASINTVITDVDTEAMTITVANSVSSLNMDSGAKIYIRDVFNKEICGLGYIFDEPYVYGYSRNSEAYFRPHTRSISEAALSESNIIDLIDEIEVDTDRKIDMILCSHKVRRKIVSLLDSSRHIVNTTDIAAGFSSVVINDVPVYADKFCPDNRIYFVNSKDFVLNQLCDWTWMEDEGGRVLKQIPGKPAYTATLVKYAELICKRPCGQGMILLTE